jgi:hypothetical protein
MTSDLYIHVITPVNGLATHHQVLGIDNAKKSPDGLAPCGTGVEFDVFNWTMLFASGVGSPTLTLPDGVAFHVHAGDQLVFQMHLLNASQQAVSSTASIDIVPLDAAALKDEAQMVLVGPLPDRRVTPDIPVGAGYVVKGKCTLPLPTSYFAVFPHMHQIGKHIAVSAVAGGQAHSLYDADYDFTNQTFAQFSPIAMAMNDQIDVTCTYDNETGAPVHFGQSSYDEMCFAISYVYPPLPPTQLGPFCDH